MTDTLLLLRRVNEVAAFFEARWTLRALRRVDPELHVKLIRQRDLWGEFYVTGTKREVEQHGGAMTRGWEAAIRAMEAAQEPDDAYLEGFDASTGTRVLVGLQKASAGRAPLGAIFITPDEVAALLAKGDNALVGDVLRHFPGATITEIRKSPDGEPATAQGAQP